MTTITYIDGRGRSPTIPYGFGAMRTAAAALFRIREYRRRRQTEKMLESLPADIRKDIGWPTSASGPSAR